MGELGDEGSDQYRVGEKGEHGMRVPPMPCRHAERWISGGASSTARSPTRDTGRAVSQDNVEEVSPMATSFKTDIVPLAPAPDEKHEGRVVVGALLPSRERESPDHWAMAAGTHH